MTPDRDTALDELASVIAEATVDAWLADKIADEDSEEASTVEDAEKED